MTQNQLPPENATSAPHTPTPTADRRQLLKNAGIGAAALGALSFARPSSSFAQTADVDVDILNFALNLEYLEAEFYLNAVHGHGLSHADSTGTGGNPGTVTGGGKKVTFSDKNVQAYAQEIANDELNHVRFLRSALGSSAVARPAINIGSSFTVLARAAGVVGKNGTFDPYANDANFLLGAFIFEDVGVTAYNGAAAAITNPDYLTAAASILAVEAYHAGSIRLQLIQMGLTRPADKIAELRAILSNAAMSGAGDDMGVTIGSKPNIVPTDANSLAYARTTGEVLNIVYGGGSSNNYLFFPNKLNGNIS